jgi:hypothetical protein
MEWHAAVEIMKPYIVGVSTPGCRGTGFLVSRSSSSPLFAIATAAHVVADADAWEQPIRIQHHDSGKSMVLHEAERVIVIDHASDSAAIVFSRDDLPLPAESLDLIAEGKIKKVGVELGWLGFPSVSPSTLCFFSGRISAQVKGDETYLVDGVAINGVSGGPAFTCTGTSVEVVGVVAAYIANRATGEALPGLSVVQDVHHFQGISKQFRSIDEVAKKKAQDAVAEAGQAPSPAPGQCPPTTDPTDKGGA